MYSKNYRSYQVYPKKKHLCNKACYMHVTFQFSRSYLYFYVHWNLVRRLILIHVCRTLRTEPFMRGGCKNLSPPYVPPVWVLTDIKQNIQNQSGGSLPTKLQSPFHTLEVCAQRAIYHVCWKCDHWLGACGILFGSRVVLHTDEEIRRLITISKSFFAMEILCYIRVTRQNKEIHLVWASQITSL